MRVVENKVILQCCILQMFRSGFSSKPAADDARAGDTDPSSSVVDSVVTSTWLWAVSAPVNDDVKLAWAESGVPAYVHICSWPIRRQWQPAEWNSWDSWLDVRSLRTTAACARNRPSGCCVNSLDGLLLLPFGISECIV